MISWRLSDMFEAGELRLAAYIHIQSKQGGVDGLRWPKYTSNSLAKYSWKPRRFLIMLMNGHQAASSELSWDAAANFQQHLIHIAHHPFHPLVGCSKPKMFEIESCIHKQGK